MTASVSRHVAVVAFPGAEVLDVTGPLEVFSQAAYILGTGGGRTDPPAYRIEVLARRAGPIAMSSGIRLVAERAVGEVRGGIDTLLVAVGGGGLIAGIAAWYAGRIKLVGVEPVASPTLTRALAAGRPVDAEAGGVASDSLAPRRVGERVFPIVKEHVHGVVLVTDDAIVAAQQALWQILRIVAEPGGAAAFAALLSGAYRPQRGERVGVVISGGNTTAVDFAAATTRPA